MKKDLFRRVVCFMLAMIMALSPVVDAFVVSSYAQTTPAAPLAATPQNYGPLKNVTNTVTLDKGHEALCKRTLTGELIFDWPEPSTYVDVVFIQDFSGSFKSTIGNVGNAVKSMVNSLNMGVDTDGRSPKDRAMVVGYQGLQGYAEIKYNASGFTNGMAIYENDPNGDYKITNSTLISDKNTFNSWVTGQYTSAKAVGGTPTVDGMVEGKNLYKAATPSSTSYNNATYIVNGQARQRKTIYVLITDGAANAAKWANLTPAARNELRIYSGNGYYGGYYYSGLDSRPGASPYTYSSINTSYHWNDPRNSPDGAVYYPQGNGYAYIERVEAYRPMLTAMGDIAMDLRSSGGVGNKPATFVSAFWEDRPSLSNYNGGYGQAWNTTMRDVITTKLQAMAANNPSYFATSDTNIQDFSNKLVNAFKAATIPIPDKVSIKTNIELEAKSFSLYRKQANGTFLELSKSSDSTITGRDIAVDTENLAPGTYKIIYKMAENTFESADYKPADLKFTFEGTEYAIGTSTDGNIPVIPKNTRTDCEINLSKTVSSNREDFENKSQYKDLEYRRQEFYFDTVYNLTSKVQEAKNTILLFDDIDPRLDIVDGYIVSGNSAAKVDAVSGATPEGTLIAELKNPPSGRATNASVPALSLSGNRISYSLPKKPTTIGSTTYPFGGYTGKDYVLVVQTKIKDGVSDSEIQAMRTTLDPLDGKPVGVPNIAKIKMDNSPDVISNKARAVPPRTETPGLKKYIGKKEVSGTEDVWFPEFLDLQTKDEEYRYKIEMIMPHDTTGYHDLTISDQLDKSLEISNTSAIKVYYSDAAGNKTALTASQYKAIYNTSTNKLDITISESSPTEQLFEAMAEKSLSVEFPAKVKSGANLAEKYDDGIKKIIIPNASYYKVNDRPVVTSNIVNANIPLPSADLTKFTSDGATILPGAVFTLKDLTDTTELERSYTTDSEGKIKMLSLVPGHSYEVTETKAPDGYVLDSANKWTINVANDGAVTITGGPAGSVSGQMISAKNNKPETPTIQKWLKGESQTEFSQPTMANPYPLQKNDETITYQLRVPITSVKGYNKLEIVDEVDTHINPIIGTLKAFVLEDPTTVIGVNYSMTGRTMTLTKTDGFDKLEGKTLVVEVQAKVETDIKKVFESHPDGKIPNVGSLKLNDGTPVNSNEVVVQVTKGTVTMKKTTSEIDGSNPVDLASGLSAGFALYRVVGQPDPISSPEETDDIVEGNFTINGPETLKVDDLKPGKYYFLETGAPRGHVKKSGMIPDDNGFEVKAIGGVVQVLNQPFVVDNRKTDNPTVKKLVKGVNKPEYSSETYNIGIGESWNYALDVDIPTTAEDVEYKLVDNIPKWFEIQNIKVYSRDKDDPQWPTTEDTKAKGYLAPYDYSNPNHIELNVPVGGTTEYRGKSVRIEVTVRVRPGTNLETSGALSNDGTIPNTVSLTHGSTTITSTVSVRPVLLRNINFTKKLGTEVLSGALFKLYQYNEDGSVGDQVIEPFTNKPYASTSDFSGVVKFNNIPTGKYWMVETPPPGKTAKYEKIKVTVNGIDAVEPITFTEEHDIPISSTEVFNNELIKVEGTKTWDDDGDLYKQRPGSITVKLLRKVGENGQPEVVDTQEVRAPWKYIFQDKDASKKLLKYEPITNQPYIYYIEEAPVKNYKTEITDFNIKNTLESASFRIIKRDGDKVAANAPNSSIQGTTFVLTDPNGVKQEATSGELGIVEFTNLKKGARYTLTEKSTAEQGKYLANTGSANVFVDESGRIIIAPDRFRFIDPDNDPSTDNSGFEFLNFVAPKPEKKIKVGNELLDDYDLKSHHEIVTYQIKVPVKGVRDINKLEVVDRVDNSMQIIEGSGKVFADGTDISDKFRISTTEQLRKKSFVIDRILGDVSSIENKTLIFEFQARIILTPESFAKMHTNLTVPNKATLNINDLPENNKETNVVNIKSQFTSLKFKKVLETDDGKTKDLGVGRSAIFSLERLDIDNFPIQSYTTDQDGLVNISNLDVGHYVLKETKSPDGYLKTADIFFKVVNKAGKLEIHKSDSNGLEGALVVDGNLGDVVDPLPQKPTLNKMVKAIDEAMTSEGGEYKHYDMKTWKDNFQYVVDVKLPKDLTGYEKLSLVDTLPVGLDIGGKDYNVDVKVGTGEGASFTEESDQTPYVEVPGATSVNQLIATQQYEVRFDTQSKALINKLNEKTIRFVFEAHINEKYNSIDQLTLINGNFENTAKLRVNDSINIESKATVKPVEQMGLVLKKVADFKNPDGTNVPLIDATFILSQYEKTENNTVVEKGPEIPGGLKTDYTTGKDGLMIIDKRLEKGKYLLIERYYPNTFMDHEGIPRPANFVSVYDYYVLEVGASLPNGKTGVVIKGIDRQGNESAPIYQGEAPTADKPAKIENKQFVYVPVEKVWEDENNVHNLRPQTLKFLLQRAVVNGEPDKLDPKTGMLSPAPGDAPDTIDTEFNEYAKSNSNLNVEVPIGLLPSHFEDLSLLRYTLDGALYNYYVLETVPDGYEASYSTKPSDPKFGDKGTKETVVVTNTLKKAQNLSLIKKDDSDPSTNIEGAQFNLSFQDVHGQTIVTTKTTDSNGQISLDDILVNTPYKLKEIKAPEGYLVDPAEYIIFVGKDGIPKIYTKFVSENDPGNVEVDKSQFITIPATGQEPVKYQFVVIDKKVVVPEPVKKINGENTFNLPSLTSEFEYSIEVPVTTTEGMTSFVMEDTVNDLLDIVGGSAKVEKDGKTISNDTNLVVNGRKITFTLTDGLNDIANSNVKLTFKAKIATGVTLKQLTDYVATPGNASGIPNEATLKINNNPKSSNTVYVIPGEPGAQPELDKTVNDGKHYDLLEKDEVFNYKVVSKVPENVLGYNGLEIKDTLAKVLELQGEVKLILVSEDQSTKPLVMDTDYVLTNTTNPQGETVITAKFVDGYDYTKVSGKTVVMEFRGKIKPDATSEDLSSYVDMKIPNKATIKLNDEPESQEKIATITPPTEPTIDKKVNGADNIALDGKGMERNITYTIDVTVPINVKGMNKFQVTDKINDILKVQSINAAVLSPGGDEIVSLVELSQLVPFENPVTATITGNENILKFAGKTIRLTITAKIDATKDISKYLVEGKLPNTAQIMINDQPKVEDTATITPNMGQVKISKTLDKDTTWPQGEKAVFKLEKQVGTGFELVKEIEITDFNPVTVDSLLPGKYRLTEIKAPKGYLIASPKEFSIVANSEENIEITVNDSKNPGIEKDVDNKLITSKTEERTFTIKVPVKSIDGMEKIEITDKVDEFFKIVEGSQKATLDTNTGQNLSVQPVVNGNVISLTKTDNFDEVLNKTIVLTFKATLKDGFNYEDLPSEYKTQGIPNTASLVINNQPKVDSTTVKVKVAVGNITFVKTAEGESLPAGTSATFELYQGKPSTGTKIGEYTTAKNAQGQDVINVVSLHPQDYYFVEKTPPQGYVLDETPREFKVVVDQQGMVQIQPGNNFTGLSVDNKKSEIPTPQKKVEGKDHLDLEAFDKTFSYEVKVPVTKVDGWKVFELTDNVDKSLEIKNIKVIIGNQEFSPGEITGGEFSVVDNLITFKFSAQDKIKALVGNTVILTFDAKIKGSVEEFLKAHPDAKIKNTANINVGNLSSTSNEVTVTPPGEIPTPVKSINGDNTTNALKLGKKDQKFFYDVRVEIPTNTTGYNKVSLTDKLEQVLETSLENIKVYVNDINNESLRNYLSYDLDTNQIKLEIDNEKIDKDFDFKTLAGKTLRLQIEAGFKADVTEEQLKPFMKDGIATVPNKAEFSVNNSSKESNTVNVTPPGEGPSIEKTVDDKNELLLSTKNQEFTYKVLVRVPENIEGYKNITIEDNIEKVLEVVSTDVQVESTTDPSLSTAVTNTDNKISLIINDNFSKYAAKTITLVIKAKIKDGINLDQIAHSYGNSEIPNQASLSFNGEPKTSNVVKITPPGEIPAPVKTVNAQKDIVLGNIKDEFVYNITTKIPTNVAGINTLEIQDVLEQVLQTDKSKISVFVDEVKDDKLSNSISLEQTDKTTVKLIINKGFLGGVFGNAFNDLAGKSIRVEIKANIKENADLSKYQDEKVPNKATLKLNDNPTLESNETTVKPPKGNVILTKVVDGEPLTGTQKATFSLFKQIGEQQDPQTDTIVKIDGLDEKDVDATSNKITVSGLDSGNYYFVEKQAPQGYVLNSTPIPFTITKDQNIAVALTWNNVSDLTPVKTINDGKEIEIKDLNKEFTYKVSVPVGSTSAMKKLVIKDELNPLLNIVDGSIKAYKQDGSEITGEIQTDGNTITFTKSNDLSQITNTMVTLEFKAKIKADVTIEELKAKDILEKGIPNTASISVNDKPHVSSDTVYVKPVLGDVELRKTAQHNPLPTGLTAKFELYQGQAPNGVKVGDTLSTDENGKIVVKDLIAGKYYFVESQAPQGYKLDKTPKAFNIIGGEKAEINPVVVNVDNEIADTPQVEKTVDGVKDLTLDKLNQQFTYKISVPVKDNNGINSFVIKDNLDPLLEVVEESAKVMIGSTPATEKVTVEGQIITYTANSQDISSMKDKEVTLEFKAKLKDNVTYESLVEKYQNGKIPNKATLTINDRPQVESETVNVSPKFGSVTLTKTSEGKELPKGLSAEFSLYKVSTAGDVFIKEYQTVNGKIEVLNLSPGDYYFIEKTAPQGHIQDTTTKYQFTVNADGTTVAKDNFENFTVDNKIPKDGPTINKEVDGLNHKDLLNITDEFTYKIKVAIPQQVDGYKNLVIEDKIDDLLKITEKTISMEAGSSYQIKDEDGVLTEDSNNVKFTFNEGFDYGKIKGQNVILTIKAKLDGKTAQEVSQIYKDNKIPNTAKLVFNGTPTSSNTVTVTPSGQTPSVTKDVEGKDVLNLGSLNQEFKYNVKIQVPNNVVGYTKLELKDTLENVLQIVSKEVQVAGVKHQALTDLVTVNGESVKLSLDEKYDYNELQGKLVNLVITAKIKEGADISAFINSGGIPNKATLSFNDKPEIETPEVKVVPPGEEPTVKKEVENLAQDNKDKTSLSLNQLNEPIYYNIISEIPSNVSGYSTIRIEDTLEKVLEKPNVDTVKIFVGDEDKTLDLKDKLSVDGQTVKLELKKGLFGIGGFDFTTIAGKTLKIVIPTKIMPGSDLSGYEGGKIPNKATLTFNGIPKTSNEVEVIPPGETPTPQKDVNGKTKETIDGKTKSFTYNVSYDVAENLTGISSIELRDNLEKVLETSLDKITIKVNGKDYTGGKKTYEGNSVVFTLNKTELEQIKGQTITMSIVASIKQGENLSGYTNMEIPNKAQITLNNDPSTMKETQEVVVTLKGTKDIPVEKVWDGVEQNAITLYVVKAKDKNEADGMTIEDAVQTLNLAKVTGWSGVFKGLEKYDETGTEIKYFVKEIVPKGYKEEVTIDETTGKVTVKNTETPSEIPQITKDVNGLESLNLSSLDQEYTYNVKTKVPSSIKAFTKFTLEDDLEDILQVKGTKVMVNGVEDEKLSSLVTVDETTKLVKLDIDKKTLEKYKNSNIQLSIIARIKEGVSSQELSKYITEENEEGKIPNKARLIVGDSVDKIVETVNVPVTPPGGDNPTLDKTVNGENEYSLKDIHEIHTYKIKTKISNNTTGYKTIVIKDTLESILEAQSVKVILGEEDITKDISQYGSLENVEGKISLTLNNNMASLAGKEISLEISAKVKDSVTQNELKPYLNNNAIPNKATLKFNDKPEIQDEVKVIPPSEKPELDKKVNGKDEITIEKPTDNLVYTMKVKVPENTRDISRIVLEDNFANILLIQGKATVEVKKGETVDENLTQKAMEKLTTNGQKVSLQIIGANEANQYAGSTITVTVNAKIDTTKDISSYLVQGTLPNTATLSTTNNPSEDIEDMAKVKPVLEKLSIPVSKTWMYTDGTPIPDEKLPEGIDKVFVVLYRNKESVAVKELTKANGWKESFTDLDRNDREGKEYSYTVEELPVDGFEGTQTKNPDGSISLVNKKKDTPTLSIPVQKLWSGEKPTDIKSITVVLTRQIDGKQDPDFSKKLVITGSEWKGEFTNLERVDKDGNKYIYKVSEEPIPGYEAEYIGGGSCGFVIQNKPSTGTRLELKKIKEGTNIGLANAEFELRGIDNEAFSLKKASDENGRIEFEKIPYGKYLLKETSAPQGYELSKETWTISVERDGKLTVQNQAGVAISGSPLVVANSPTTTKVEVTKTWANLPKDDNPNNHKATFVLEQTGEEKSIMGNGTITFDNLPKFDKDNNLIKYTVKEKQVEGFKQVMAGNGEDGYVFTNFPVNKFGVVLQKIDKDTKNVLPGAEFELWAKLAKEETEPKASNKVTLEKEKQDLEKEKQVLEEAIKELEEKISLASKELENGNQSLEQLKLKLNETENEEEKATIQKEIDELVKKQEETKNQLSQEKAKAEKSRKDLLEKEKQIKAVEEKLSKLENEEQPKDQEYSLVGKYTTDGNGLISIGSLKEGSYYFKETKAPQGYKIIDPEKKYEFVVPNQQDPSKPITITVLNEAIIQPEYITINGVKTWKGDKESDRPESITVKLVDTKTGETVRTISLTKDTNWKYSFKDVMVKDGKGNTYSYKVEEVVPQGYEVSYDGYNITNTKQKEPTPEPVYETISGEKTWKGDKESDRPESITVKLVDAQTGKVVKTTTATKGTNWKYDFGKVVVKDEKGNTYSYKVEEVVPQGYEVSYDGYNITNTKQKEPTPEPVYETISGEKTWKGDKETDRPESITVKLVDAQTGKVVKTTTATKGTNWKYDFGKVVVKDEQGNNYSYRVEEELPQGYVVSYDGYNITNTKPQDPIPGKPVYEKIYGEKTWKGDKESDRPASIRINLVDTQTGKTVKSVEATKDTQWKYDFGEMIVMDEKGKTYSYRVEEVVPQGYVVSYQGYNITNTKKDEPPKPEPEKPEPSKPDVDNPKPQPPKPSKPTPTKPLSPVKPTKKPSISTINPKTLVEGYTGIIVAMVGLGAALIFVDHKRRKTK